MTERDNECERDNEWIDNTRRDARQGVRETAIVIETTSERDR